MSKSPEKEKLGAYIMRVVRREREIISNAEKLEIRGYSERMYEFGKGRR